MADTFKVGYNNSGMPFSAVDMGTQKMQGFMVDLMEQVASVQGFDLLPSTIEFGALIPSLTSGKIDISAAPMYSTEARQKVVSFSTPLYTYGEGLLVKSTDDHPYTSLQSLAGEKVGAVAGTIFIDHMNQMGIFQQVQAYANESDMMRDIANGRITAGIVDQPLIAYQLKKDPSAKVKLVAGYQPQMAGSIAIAVAKTNPELLTRINDGIARLKADGQYEALMKKWALVN
ncbi:ABC transporter substrate-binding protein [Pseudomonas silvicola]|nr:ABC transporter substrate-binding protein [Pseudomonas silvicola]